MPYLLAILGGLVVLWLIARAFVSASPAQIVQGLRWGGIFTGAVAIVLLTLSGRLPQALFAAAALVPVLARFKGLWNRWRAADGPQGGQVSEVETEWLRMRLDHDTGAMTGTVRRGHFAGRRLDELDRDALLELLRQCRVDDESSAKLLEAYLDRCFGDWRGGAQGGARQERQSSGPSPATMTRDEAYEILGLGPGASAAEIKAAHRRLMAKLHPDHGGSTWLAARINLAKDTLLKT